MSGWSSETQVFYQVLLAWEDWSKTRGTDPSSEAEKYRDLFLRMSAQKLRKALDTHERRKNEDEEYGFVFVPARVEAAKPTLYPVVMFGFRKNGKAPETLIRVATYFDGGSEVRAFGWRFEPADRGADEGSGFHHFPHVQAISSWEKDRPDGTSDGLHAPNAYDPTHVWLDKQVILENRPAFPLPYESVAGALVCVIAALYGSNGVREILESYEGKPANFAEEVKRITHITV